MAQHVFPPPDSGSDAFYDEDDASSVDAGLVARALRGDSDAFATLFDRHVPRVYALAYRILGREGEAEDVTQDAFLHALNVLPTLRRGESFRPWVMRIATNLAWATLRQRLRLPQAELTDAVVATHPDTGRWGSPEAMGLAAEDQRAVRLTLDRLAPTHRAALAMREIGGLSYAAIAASLGTTTGSVEVLLFRARARFRDEYRKVALGAGVSATSVVSCVQTPRVLAVLADHEGSDEERVRAEAHARHCASCAAQLGARKDSRKLLLALPLTVPATIKAGVLSRAGPILVSHAATASAAGGALTAVGGVSAGGAGAGVVAVSGAEVVAGGTLAGTSMSFVSIVGAGGLAAKIAAIAVMAAIVAAVVVVKHAPSRPTPPSSAHARRVMTSAHARRVTTSAPPVIGAITTPSVRLSPGGQASRPPSAATALFSPVARSLAASSHPTAARATARVAVGTVGGSGPGAVGTASAMRGTPPTVSAFGTRSGATGRATAPANAAGASATTTSSSGAARTITTARRFAGGPTATTARRLAGGPTATTTVTPRRPGTLTAPAVATAGATGSGGAVGGAARTATAAAPLVPTARRTPAASAVAGTPVSVGFPMTTTPVPTGFPMTTTPVPDARTAVSSPATPTPRAAKPAMGRANHGRPARSVSRSVTAVPTAPSNVGRSTGGVAVLSPAPGRRSPITSPTPAAARAVRPPPVTTRVAPPPTGHGAAAVATVTALPGSAATTIAHTVASAPTVAATLIPVLPMITAVAPSVIPGVPTGARATITAPPLPTIPGGPVVPPPTVTVVVPPLPTVTVVVPPLPTVTVVAPPTPVPTIPAALPSSIPTMAPTIDVPTTATATPGLLPSVVPSVPVPPDGSNAPPTVPVMGISTPPAATATPTTTGTATATASATASSTPLPALLVSQDIGTIGVAGSTLDVAGLYTIAGWGGDIGGKPGFR